MEKKARLLCKMLSFLVLPALAVAAPPALTVAAASSLQYALDRIDSGFTERHKAPVIAVYGSSGKLASQARNGAPFDIFISADMAYPDSIRAWKLASGETVPYALGTVVLWTLREDLDLRAGLRLLTEASVRKVAIPDPVLAPFGKAALAALEKAGVAGSIAPKLIYAQSVGQAGQFILSGSVDAGFSARAMVQDGPMKDRGRWMALDSSVCPPILQGAIALKSRSIALGDLQRKYMEYLVSREGQDILRQSGYLTP